MHLIEFELMNGDPVFVNPNYITCILPANDTRLNKDYFTHLYIADGGNEKLTVKGNIQTVIEKLRYD